MTDRRARSGTRARPAARRRTPPCRPGSRRPTAARASSRRAARSCTCRAGSSAPCVAFSTSRSWRRSSAELISSLSCVSAMRFSTCAFSLASSSSSCCHSSRRRWYSACAAARSASVSCLLMTFSRLVANAAAMSPNIWPPSCRVTNGELNPPAAPVWNSGIACITFATRSMPSATPGDHLRRRQRLLLRLLLRVHQLLELRVEVLHLHVDVLALQRQLGERFLDLPHLLLADVAHRVEQDRLVRGPQRGERLRRRGARAPAASSRRSCGSPRRAAIARSSRNAEPVVRRRRVEAGDHAAEIDAGGRRAHEQAGIDRRLEQRAAGARCPGCSCSCGS